MKLSALSLAMALGLMVAGAGTASAQIFGDNGLFEDDDNGYTQYGQAQVRELPAGTVVTPGARGVGVMTPLNPVPRQQTIVVPVIQPVVQPVERAVPVRGYW